MKKLVSAAAFAALMAAGPAFAASEGAPSMVLAALAPNLAISAPSTPAPDSEDKGIQLSEWIGAPCMSNDDCGDYKCENSVCVEK
jgi:uncharacterized membrane protein